MHNVYLLTGSNVGDKQAHLHRAFNKIGALAGGRIQASAIYQTQPWGVLNHDDYLNQAIQIETALSATELLKGLRAIETSEGRTGDEKNTPRTLDIDILFYDDLLLESAVLVIPHPRLHLRRFVLEPLCEIAPHFIHPVLKKKVSVLLQECADTMQVHKLL